MNTTSKKFSLLQMFRIKSFQARKTISLKSLWYERKNILYFRNRIQIICSEPTEQGGKKKKRGKAQIVASGRSHQGR